MEILNRREQIGAKKLPPVIGDDVEKAGKSKYGVVKVGDGINVSNGVISVPASVPFTVDTLYSGANQATTEYTFPTGKTLASYNFLVIAIDDPSQSHDCVTTLVPVAQIIANETLYTTLIYQNQYYLKVKVQTDKVVKYDGYADYYVNKIYAF